MSRQQAILDYIVLHNKEKGYSPTFREIGKAVGLKSCSTVAGHIERLEKRGLIKRIPSSPRTLEVIQDERDDESTVTIMRRRVAIKVLETDSDGTFTRVLIGGKTYVLDAMG